MANKYKNLVKGSSMRQKLQNTKGYAESPDFLPALGKQPRPPKDLYFVFTKHFINGKLLRKFKALAKKH